MGQAPARKEGVQRGSSPEFTLSVAEGPGDTGVYPISLFWSLFLVRKGLGDGVTQINDWVQVV